MQVVGCRSSLLLCLLLFVWWGCSSTSWCYFIRIRWYFFSPGPSNPFGGATRAPSGQYWPGWNKPKRTQKIRTILPVFRKGLFGVGLARVGSKKKCVQTVPKAKCRSDQEMNRTFCMKSPASWPTAGVAHEFSELCYYKPSLNENSPLRKENYSVLCY